MTSSKTPQRRRSKPKAPAALPFERRNFPQEISQRLERIVSLSGQNRARVFSDLVLLAEATLQALPEQLKAVGATGRFAPDPPETAELLAQVRAGYRAGWLDEARAERIWHNFGQAFALLLEATTPGLWGQPNSLNIAGPLSGPDILGYLYQTWAHAGGSATEVYTPWPLARLLAQLTLGQDGERLVHERLKQALGHPDNLLGAATLLAGLALPEEEPETARAYFINQVVPAAAGFYRPLLYNDPAAGSNILALARLSSSRRGRSRG